MFATIRRVCLLLLKLLLSDYEDNKQSWPYMHILQDTNGGDTRNQKRHMNKEYAAAATLLIIPPIYCQNIYSQLCCYEYK